MAKIKWLTISLLLILQKTNSFPHESNYRTKAPGPEYFLPTKVEPINYKLDLIIEENFHETRNFSGQVTIEVLIKEDTDVIVLHAENLDIEPSEKFTTSQGDYDKLELKYPQILSANTKEYITLTYTGKLRTIDMYGFYLSSYVDNDKNTHYVATTQFQATHARKAFPCFDEPNFKATFDVSITHSPKYTALFNTYGTDETIENKVKTTFKTTPKMSTYLVAFVVSEFKGYGENEGTKSDYDVFCREEALKTAQYAYEVGPKILKALDDYTNIKYYDHIEKMHQLAIPDFAAGAMENWGLVTYRETALLWDPEESTTNNKNRVATVIAHEFAHMWFGNLITLKWWQYTWLNEGFARYLQYFITKEVETAWELEKLFVVEQQQSIQVSDAVSTSLSLNSQAYSPDEVNAKFGSISYSKGGSVIRMMNFIMGEEQFKDGIRNYLKDNFYGNTEPDQLWEKLKTDRLPTGKEMKDIMENWTEKSGFPVVTAKLDKNDLVLTQERFLYSKTDNNEKTTWYIPITYTTSHEPNFDSNEILWLTPDGDQKVENILHGGTGWVLINLNANGYYRVNYDDVLWNQLETALKSENFGTIPVIDRAQIVDDVFNLARGGYVTYERALDVTSYLEEETEYYPWYSALSSFSYLRRRRGESEYLETHIRELMTKLYKSVSFDVNNNDDHIKVLKTTLALEWSCNLQVEDCVENAKELFKKYKDNGTKIDPNLRSTVYCTALRNSENPQEDWDFLWEKFTSSSLANEQVTILSALGCTKEESILKEYLLKSITAESGIRKQDARSVFTAVLAGNLNGVNVAYEFFEKNIKALSDYYTGMNDLSNIISSMADRFTTKEQVEKFKTFTAENEEYLKEAVKQVQSSIESAEANLNWPKDDLDDWLDAHYNSSNSIVINFTLLIGLVLTSLYAYL